MPATIDTVQRIGAAVTPAVMVSACGLIALGLDNQVARMSLRLRDLVREHREGGEATTRRQLLRLQVEAFDARHRILTHALQMTYGALLAFVLTSFLELSSGLLPVPGGLPLVTFAGGVGMLGGMAILVMRSMARARAALVLERREIESSMSAAAREHPARA